MSFSSFFSNAATAVTLQYMDYRKKKKYEEERLAARQRHAEKWNREHNAVSVEEARKIFYHVLYHKDEVFDYLIDSTIDRTSEEYQKEVKKYKHMTVEELCEEYTHKKYNKNCYPLTSKTRSEWYTQEVDLGDFETKIKYRKKGWL